MDYRFGIIKVTKRHIVTVQFALFGAVGVGIGGLIIGLAFKAAGRSSMAGDNQHRNSYHYRDRIPALDLDDNRNTIWCRRACNGYHNLVCRVLRMEW